jgi:hypothetical protein
LAKVCHWVRRGDSIHITLGYSPIKNPQTVAHRHADWAEFFAFCHLAAWHNKVCAVYPPGLRIKIIFDDSMVGMANRPDRALMDAYMTSIARLATAMDYGGFIVGTMRQSSFAWLFRFGLYQLAGRRVRQWEREPAHQEALDKMTAFARRNLLLPTGLNAPEQERLYREASHRYRVYWEALQLSGFTRLGHNLIAMYMDGSQHHIRQTVALHLASVGKEQVTQPWQGEGALLDNGKGLLVPTVLTHSRRVRMSIQEISGLNILPVPALDHIAVCRENRDIAGDAGPHAGAA